jgi:iodotyrosine deiodinase
MMEAQYHPLQFERLSEAEQIEHAQAFLTRMRERRTVRDFSSEPVPFALIEAAIATAGTAPSGANQQPWTFVVVSDQAIKRKIREAAEIEERDNYEWRMSQEWKDALAHLGTDEYKPHLEDAPYLIVVFAQPYSFRIDPVTGEKVKVKHYYVAESVGIAVGFLLASLHQSGLATLTHTPNPMAFLSEILERPENERAYVVIPVGYPKPDAHVPVITKKPLSQILIRK